MSSAARPRSVHVRPALLPALLVAALVAILALLASPPPVRADCTVGNPGCTEVDRTSGWPGTRVTILPFGAGCDPALEHQLEWVDGPYDEARTYPTSPLEVGILVDASYAAFVVPDVSPGVYSLALRCDSDIVAAPNNPDMLLPFEFTVLATPATDADPVTGRLEEGSGIPIVPIALATLAAFLIALTVPQRVRDRRP